MTPLDRGNEALALEQDARRESPPGILQATVTDAGQALRIGRYEIEWEIERRGIGAVWHARDLDLGRPLAVKVLQGEYLGQPEFERLFREEARLTGQLQHPGVPPVHEAGTLPDGRPFFAMKLIQGVTLDELLRRRSAPGDDLPRFLHVVERVAQVLAYAHSRCVIHRDIEPVNVRAGEFGEVQIADWSHAQRRRKDEGARADHEDRSGGPSVSHPTFCLLLPSSAWAYMAPEQARGETDQLDERCDVFGLGGLLCMVLTGQPPHRGSNRDEIQARAARGDLGDALARLQASGMDDELILLTRRCLAAKKEDRPANGAEVFHALADYQSRAQQRLREAERRRDEVEARMAEVAARSRGKRRSRRLLVVLVGLLLLIPAAGGAWGLLQKRAAALDRQAHADAEVLLALERGRGLLDEGWQAQGLGLLRVAKVEADRLVGLAGDRAVSESVREQAAAFQNDATNRLERAGKNRALLDALLDVAAPREAYPGKDDGSGRMLALPRPRLDARFAAAFQRWGKLDVDDRAEWEVVARLRQEPVRHELIAALDVWMLERRQRNRPEAHWRRLFAVAQHLGPDERARQLRALLVGDVPPSAASVAGLVTAWPAWTGLWELERGQRWRRLQELRAGANPRTDPVCTVALLAQASAALGDGAGAEQVLRQAVAARPDQVVLLDALGRLLEQHGGPRLAEAIECYRAVRALRPGLGCCLARALIKAGRAAEAEALLRDSNRQQPERRFYLACALVEQKKLDEASREFRQVIARRPDFALAHNNLGVVLAAQKKPDEAAEAFRKATELEQGNALSHNNLGHALTAQKKPDEAVEALGKAIGLAPGLAQAHCNLGIALRDQKKLVEAEAAFRQALALRPDCILAHHHLASVLREQKVQAEVEAVCRLAIALASGGDLGYTHLGNALGGQADLDKAVAACRRPLAEVCTSRGNALRARKQLAEAEAAYRQAIALQPDYAPAHTNLGNVLDDQKKPAEAVAAYRQAIALQPDLPEPHLNLGLVLRQQAQFEEALAALKKGQTLLPAGQRSRKIRDLIELCQRQLMLDRRLSAVRKGTDKPESRELIEFAQLCLLKRLYAAATRFHRDAFAADPRSALDVRASVRYDAACGAVLAGCGRGKDADARGDEQRVRWRQQGLNWLLADLARWSKDLDANPREHAVEVRQRMSDWQGDPDLADIRDPDALFRLPEAERKRWQQFWAEVAALKRRATRAD